MNKIRIQQSLVVLILTAMLVILPLSGAPARGALEQNSSQGLMLLEPASPPAAEPAAVPAQADPPVFPYLQDIPPVDLDIDLSQETAYLDNLPRESISASTEVTVTLGAWRNLRPTESYLRGVSLLSPDWTVDCNHRDQKSRGWIVGDEGVILTYCNGIWDHAIIVESLPTTLFAVQAISPTLAVAVGEEGAVLMYKWDAVADGYVWTKAPLPVGNQILYGVSMARYWNAADKRYDLEGWAVGEKDPILGRGTLIRGTIKADKPVIDGHPTYSSNWEPVTEDYPNLPAVDYYFGVQMLSADDGWIVGGMDTGTGVILHWNGSTWNVFQEIDGQSFLGIHMRSANDGWIVGNGGAIYHFNGSTWSQVSSPTTSTLFSVSFAPDGTGWAAGMGGTIIKYSGGRWNPYTEVKTDAFDYWGMDFTSGDGWMAGFHLSKTIGGQILNLDESEDIWYAVTPPTDNQINELSVIADNEAWGVGAADELGGTIIYWDGRHWQRWFQKDLPIPAIDLYTIDMLSTRYGWAAGDPPQPAEPAIMLNWDGRRWAPPRYDSPINVRVNDLDLLDEKINGQPFGWAVADQGNAVAKYDGESGYWSANHTRYGIYYQLRGTSIVTATNYFPWDAWSLGTSLNPATGEYFMHYTSGSDGWAWDAVQHPYACNPPPTPDDGGSASTLWGMDMMPGPWGFAVGNYKERMSIYYYDDSVGRWVTDFCEDQNSPNNPTRLYSANIVEDSGVGWFGGYYFSHLYNRKVAYIVYKDTTGYKWGKTPFPLNGKNIYDRPIRTIAMSSDTMGWAAGDPEDGGKRSILYQYPFPNFTLTSSPESQAVLPGGATDYTVSANSIGGFSADVTLSSTGSLPGVDTQITPETINAGNPATVHIQTSPNTPLGAHKIEMLGYAVFHSGDFEIPVFRYFDLTLNVTLRPVYSISPAKGPAGTQVTISGANFGADPGAGNRSTAQNHVTWAGAQLPDANIISWSDTQIRFTPPDNPDLFQDPDQKFPLEGAIVVTASGSPSNDDLTFQIEPRISSLQSVPSANLMLVTLQGTSFGNDPGALNRSTVYEHISVGGTWVPEYDVVSWSNNEIQFYLDVSTPSGLVGVTSNGYESNTVSYYPPGEEEGNLVYLPMLRR